MSLSPFGSAYAVDMPEDSALQGEVASDEERGPVDSDVIAVVEEQGKEESAQQKDPGKSEATQRASEEEPDEASSADADAISSNAPDAPQNLVNESNTEETFLADAKATGKEVGIDQLGFSEETVAPIEPGTMPLVEESVTAESELGDGYESVPAPCSSKQLEPGNYTVTANIYVPSELNEVLPLNAYVTNPANPSVTGTIPNTPVYKNARLVVSESGEATLSVDIVNDVFTVQSMTSGDGIEIIEIQRNNKEYGRPQLDGACWTGRITHVDVRLANWSGLYNFGTCEERATLGNLDFSIPLRVAVDLENAVKDFTGGTFSRTYTDDTTGISLEVSCNDNQELINKLVDASLQVKNVTQDDAYKKEYSQAKDSFESCVDLLLYDIRLLANGEEVDVSAAESLRLAVPSDKDAGVLQVTKSDASALVGSVKDGVFSGVFPKKELGVIAVATEAAEWPFGPEVLWSDDLGASITLATTNVTVDSCPWGIDNCFVCMNEPMYTPKGIGKRHESDLYFELAQSQESVFARDFDEAQINSVYALAQYEDMMNFGTVLSPSWRHFGKSQVLLTASLPAADSTAEVYLLEGTLSGITNVIKIDSTYKNGIVCFDMVDRDPSEPIDVTSRPTSLPSAQFNAAFEKAFDDLSWGHRELTASDPIAFFVVVSESPKVIEKPVAATGLVYNGAEQMGVPGGEGYSVTLQGSATEPGNYTALVTLKDGYVWSDGTTAPVMISWSIAEAPKPVEPAPAPSDKLAPGTYTGTTNLFVPGSVNDIIKGLTAYMTNPKNPLVAAGDPNYGLPTSPMADNAKLVVTTDGRYLLDLSLPNPAFTLIDFGTASGGAKVLGVQRDGKAYGANAFGRITRAVIEVPADKTFSTVFASSHVYAAPLQMDKYWNVSLNVDTTSAKKVSDSTAIDIPGGNSGSSGNQGSNSGSNGGSGNSGNADGNGAGGNGSTEGTGGNGGNVTVPGVTVPGSNGSSAGGSTTVTGNNGALSGMVAGSAAAASATKLTQGTYTVTCNIWFDKETTGLPLNPHITSGAFPPKDPVSNNAKLRVDANGRCTVTVPISIQHKVMKVNSVSGLSVVDSASADGALSSITVDLGVLSPRDTVVRKSCTVGITMGDLAGTISGITGSKSWPATFQLNFAGVPASGGGTIPAAALAAMAGSDGVSDTQDAANAALAALADDTVTADDSPMSTAVNEDGTPLASGMGSEAGLAADRFSPEALERELAANPWMAFALGALCTLAVGAAAWGGRRYYLARATARETQEVRA